MLARAGVINATRLFQALSDAMHKRASIYSKKGDSFPTFMNDPT